MGQVAEQLSLEISAINEGDIMRLLERRHQDDIFVPHCKTGSSWVMPGVKVLDAWVMPRSWVKPVIAYEIKTSRSDFLRDRKWQAYLKYCHRFYFVTPFEMVSPSEIEAPAGLCYVTKREDGIRIVKPARTMNQKIPASIFKYVIMWRTSGICDPVLQEEEVQAT